MNIKFKESGIVHKNEDPKTGCGFDFRDNKEDWSFTNNKITCNKDGCKN